MKTALLVDRVLIVLFALSSGAYKLAFGPADIEIYAHLGFSPVATAVFGLVQAVFGVLCVPARTRVVGAIGLGVCNTVATLALFAAGIQPFGWISWVFVAMALVQLADRPSSASPAA